MTKAQLKRYYAVEDAINDLEALIEELQEKHESKSEDWQGSERGIENQNTLDTMGNLLDELQGIDIPDLE